MLSSYLKTKQTTTKIPPSGKNSHVDNHVFYKSEWLLELKKFLSTFKEIFLFSYKDM